jgi:signal transduction histidine kinase
MLIGLPILGLTMVLWTLGARAERWWIGLLFQTKIRPPYRPLPAGSWVRRGWTFASDPAVWRDLFYMILLFPLGIVEFVIAIVLLTIPISMVTAPAYYWTSPDGVCQIGSHSINTLPEALLLALAGLPLLLVVMPYALTGTAAAHVAFARFLLGTNREEELEARVGTLTQSRSRAVDAALAERRRIERDLHDGAQQRLVALAMELGMAKIKMENDPAAARELVDRAHLEAKQALVEIRNLVRGIHPAVLTDRGLDPAISALAGRCPVPVAVIVDVDERFPDVVESTAYFVVAEALTNIAKHSVATEAMVNVRREGDLLVVEVCDNGLGGADPATGTGLAGLSDRVAALDGRLTVHSPRGGPTCVRAEIPCAW